MPTITKTTDVLPSEPTQKFRDELFASLRTIVERRVSPEGLIEILAVLGQAAGIILGGAPTIDWEKSGRMTLLSNMDEMAKETRHQVN